MNSSAPSAIDARQATSTALDGDVAHGRYQIESVIGEGGMATVYAAVDVTDGKRVALKRLRCDNPAKRAAFGALFEREFLALSELSHPRIVAVYDYGIDAHGPYYTMELLDGGDLRRCAPADHRVACALARDVCSALSLVHARRLVFRDLSPSNVRRTSDGLAKLIDFGGLVPVGPSQDMVGTLPCVPPEALNQEPLDARTDLYALGATLYYTLVRKHAYPARDVAELTRLWRDSPPRPPSEYLPGIPHALDRLVLDLLQLDTAMRPSSAAEVMERLSAIAQLPVDESLLVEQAYLATPKLVAREPELAQLRDAITQAKAGTGATLLITGPAGAGRTRLLDSATLEAKLAGMLVLRASADSGEREYDAVRAIARSLLRQAPRLAREHARAQPSQLGWLVPELVGAEGQLVAVPTQPEQHTPQQLQSALRAWLSAVARECPLMIAVDDAERIDPESLTLFALLARELGPEPLLLVATRTNDGAQRARPAVLGALHILTRVSSKLRLAPLSLGESERLLGSMFGEVPHLALTTLHVQRVTGGVPRDIIALARHLIGEGLIRYDAGAWSLPQRLSATDLPANMADALALRVQKLGPDARELAYVLAAEPQLSFPLSSLAQVLEFEPERVSRAAHELGRAELLSRSEVGLRASQSTQSAPIASALDEATRKQLHARLAIECTRRGDALRTAQHLFRAGHEEAAVNTVISHSIDSVARTNFNTQAFHELLRSQPEDWLGTYERAISACTQAGRPPSETRAILRRLSGLLAHAGSDVDGSRHLQAMLESLARDAGLDLFEALPESMGPGARIQTAIGQAIARFQETPEAQRGLDPRAALQELAGQTVSALGMLAFTNSYAAWRALPSLEPLGLLSPTLGLVHELSQGVGMRIGGRVEAAIAVYQRILARLSQPDGAGLDPSHHLHTQTRVMGALGVLDAAMARPSCLSWAQQVALVPGYQSQALLIEQLYHLYQGNPSEARQIEQRLELIRLETHTHANEAHFEFSVLCAHALSNNLTGVKRSNDALRSRARLHASFRAALAFGRAEYQRIRGDHAAALVELEQALPLMKPGQHLLWAPAAAAQLRALLELGRESEAVTKGRAYLAQAGE
ncbi:MAG TPA: AAA family ATPase, partial [Polyangiales bacterium]